MSFDVTVTVTIDFVDEDRETLERLADAVADQLDDRTDNGAVSIDLGKMSMEVEAIARSQDVELGGAIARRVILESLGSCGIQLAEAPSTERREHSLVPA